MIDDEHLTCQRSMFELREIYAVAGLSGVDWRQRPDDHLVLQLIFIAHAARAAASRDDWALYNGCIAYLLMGALFGGEWLFRRFFVTTTG